MPPLRRFYGPSLAATGPRASRSTLFLIPPVPRGRRPFTLAVYDSFEEVLDVMSMSAMSNSPVKPRQSKPVPVDTIVADLLKEWTGGLIGVPAGAMPGVMEIHPIRSEMQKYEADHALLPLPSTSELEQMTAQQSAYFEYLFTEGEKWHRQQNWQEITDTMRLAADWLGHERDWSHRAIARDSSPCPWCTTIVSNKAVICPACQRQIREAPAHLLDLANPQLAAGAAPPAPAPAK